MVENYAEMIERFSVAEVLNEAADLSKKTTLGHAKTMLVHMLKYKFQQNKQSASWMNRILEEHLMLCKGLSQGKGYVNFVKENYVSNYAKAVAEARDETENLVVIPDDIQPEMTYEKITDIDSVLGFFRIYQSNQEAKEYLEGRNKGYYKNLSEINNNKQYRSFRIQTFGKEV